MYLFGAGVCGVYFLQHFPKIQLKYIHSILRFFLLTAKQKNATKNIPSLVKVMMVDGKMVKSHLLQPYSLTIAN